MTFRLCDWTVSGVGLVSLAMCLAGAIPAFSEERKCPETDAGLSLPNGFCATIFADNVGHARQLVVAPDGTVYVNTWSGVYYNNDTPPAGGFLIALKDTKGTGKADVNVRFGPTAAEGAHGGTGIALYKNWLYAEINDRIVRYELKNGETAPTGKAETILSGMPITGDHPMHPFAIDAQGNLFVSMGSATNACEVQNRMPHSPGNDPCTELETRAGIWRYDANKTDQVFSPKERYATGNRNGEGFRLRCRRSPLRHPTWPRPAARELARTLHTAAGFRASCRRGDDSERGRQLRMADLLFRPCAEKACARARVWR